MSFCSNCGHPLEGGHKFCSVCGARVAEPVVTEPVRPAEPVMAEPFPVQPTMVEAAPTQPVQPVQPVYAYAPVQPAVAATPVPTKKDKILGFVGMGLSIGGLFLGVIGLLYTFIFLAGEVAVATTVFALFFGMFSMPLSIVGRILSKKSMDAGNVSTPCSIGCKLGLAGIIVSAVMLFFGLIGSAI